MSTQGTLEDTFKEIILVVKPSPEEWAARLRIFNELRGVVESVESLRGATVEPFGSFVSNLFTWWGDLDVSIEYSNHSLIFSCGKKKKQHILSDLMRAMTQKVGWRKFKFIPNARVPLLRVESNLPNISCDISVNNLIGQMKSKLSFRINEIDARFRDIVLLVKEWVKAHHINNSKSGTFNSYSLSLLVVFHFQTCSPAILPPLKDIYPRNLVDDLKGSRADAERLILETCAANIRRFKSNKLRQKNRSSLSELFISFLGKFSGIDMRASELGICTYTGQCEAIESNMRCLAQNYAIFIEDPFEQPENAARKVSRKALKRISAAFEMTYHRLILANHSSLANQSSLLATLIQPQTLRLIGRTPLRNPVYNFEQRQATHPQRYRAESSHSQTPTDNNGSRQPTRPLAHSPSQAQPQYQKKKKKPKNQPKRSTTKKPLLQTSQDQQQQKWRPKSDGQM